MSAKLIIWCPGRPIVNGSKRRTFQWNPTYSCYVHENQVFDEKEFNAVVDGVFKKNADLRPCVRVVGFSDGVAATPDAALVSAAEHEKLKAKYKALQDRIAGTPVATISGGAEITLEAAIEVVQRQAPERLRKTHTGGRPKAQPQMEVA